MTQLVRLSNRDAASLRRQARAVNVVWNYCNRVQRKAVEDRQRWLSAYDLMKLTAGAGELLGLHSHTVSGVCKHYDEVRRGANAPWLWWRGRHVGGWVPFNTGHVAFDGEHIVFRGERFTVVDGLGPLVPGVKLRSGAFYAGQYGDWFLEVRLEATGAPARVGAPTSTRSALEQGRRQPLPPMQRQTPRPSPIVSC